MTIIKYLLSKSVNLITINVIIGTLLTLCLSGLVRSFIDARNAPFGLSDKCISFTLKRADETSNQAVTIPDLISQINNDVPFALIKKDYFPYCGIYFNGNDFSPNIIDGRNFNEDDFINHQNVALVSSEAESNCTEEDGIKIISVNNINYEVIGVFQKNPNTINRDAEIYYNLFSENVLNYENNAYGQYIIDTVEPIKNTVTDISELGNVSTDMPYTTGLWDSLEIAISAQAYSLIVIVLIALMIALNSISVSAFWIEKRRKEFFIRKLTGARSIQINMLLIRDYWLVLTASYVFSFLLSYIISNIEFILFDGFDFSVITLVFAYGLTLFAGFSSMLPVLFSYNRRGEISKMTR